MENANGSYSGVAGEALGEPDFRPVQGPRQGDGRSARVMPAQAGAEPRCEPADPRSRGNGDTAGRGGVVARGSAVGRGRQFADGARGAGGRRLFPLRRANDILVRDRFVIALFLALEIEVADAERPGAIVDPEDAALLLVAGRDQAVVARLLLRRPVAAAVAVGDPERARTDVGSPRIVGELAGDDVAGQLVEPVDQRKVDLRGGQKLVLGRLRGVAAPPSAQAAIAARPTRKILRQHRRPPPTANHLRPSWSRACSQIVNASA